MGRMFWAVLGTVLAVWLILMAVGGIVPLIKVFITITLLAVAIFIVVSWLAKGHHG